MSSWWSVVSAVAQEQLEIATAAVSEHVVNAAASATNLDALQQPQPPAQQQQQQQYTTLSSSSSSSLPPPPQQHHRDGITTTSSSVGTAPTTTASTVAADNILRPKNPSAPRVSSSGKKLIVPTSSSSSSSSRVQQNQSKLPTKVTNDATTTATANDDSQSSEASVPSVVAPKMIIPPPPSQPNDIIEEEKNDDNDDDDGWDAVDIGDIEPDNDNHDRHRAKEDHKEQDAAPTTDSDNDHHHNEANMTQNNDDVMVMVDDDQEHHPTNEEVFRTVPKSAVMEELVDDHPHPTTIVDGTIPMTTTITTSIDDKTTAGIMVIDRLGIQEESITTTAAAAVATMTSPPATMTSPPATMTTTAEADPDREDDHCAKEVPVAPAAVSLMDPYSTDLLGIYPPTKTHHEMSTKTSVVTEVDPYALATSFFHSMMVGSNIGKGDTEALPLPPPSIPPTPSTTPMKANAGNQMEHDGAVTDHNITFLLPPVAAAAAESIHHTNDIVAAPISFPKEDDNSAMPTTVDRDDNLLSTSHPIEEVVVVVPTEANHTELIEPAAGTVEPPATAAAAAANKLVVLISTQSMNREVKRKQDHALLTLNVHHIDYEIIDGATNDPTIRELRNDLFAMIPPSHDYSFDDNLSIRSQNIYPQFYIVDCVTGSTNYWGNYEQFVNIVEEGLVKHEFDFQNVVNNPMAAVVLDIPHQQHQVAEEEVKAAVLPDTNDDHHPSMIAPPAKDELNVMETNVVLQHVTEQMKRLEENYQNEIQQMKEQHNIEMQKILDTSNDSLKELQRNHDATEQQYKYQIDLKDQQIDQLCRRNEGYRLKLDVLKREVTGLTNMIEERDRDMGGKDQKHIHEIEGLRKKVTSSEQMIHKAKEHASTLEKQIEDHKKEYHTLQEEYKTLKNRVKDVATELKARRIECRELHNKVKEMEQQYQQSLHQIQTYQEQSTDRHLVHKEMEEEMRKYKQVIMSKDDEIVKMKQEHQLLFEQKEQSMMEYKKKVQHSLSMTNARIASAVQAKEEAELQARSSRTIADQTMMKYHDMETSMQTMQRQYQQQIQQLQNENMEMNQKYTSLQHDLSSLRQEYDNVQLLLQKSYTARDDKQKEYDRMIRDYKNYDTLQQQHKIYEQTIHTNEIQIQSLHNEIHILQNKLAVANAAAATEEQYNKKHTNDIDTISNTTRKERFVSQLQEEDALLVSSLQQELRDANAMIEELQDALKNAVMMSQNHTTRHHHSKTHRDDDYDSDDDRRFDENGYETATTTTTNNTGGGYSSSTSSAPPPALFYAIEKQAELDTARNEIHRLSALLSELQSSKTDAYDAMELMRKRMEDAEARLRRYEKLAAPAPAAAGASSMMPSSPTVTRHTPSAMMMPTASPTSASTASSSSSSDAATNIEYLKNVLLRFLQATTMSEKKALVPVIGAVLCLTPDEIQSALQHVESSSSSSLVVPKTPQALAKQFLSWS